MSRTLNRLSARFAATVMEAGRYADGGNLYLSVSANGGRRWVFFFQHDGRQREMGLGSAREVSLAKARERAAEARRLLSEGINPLDAKAAPAPRQVTFGDVADAYLEVMRPNWRNAKHREQWETSLGSRDAVRGAETYAKSLRSKLVAEVTTEDVLAVLLPLWQAKPETASRLRGRVEAVLDAAIAKGQRAAANPARWRGHLDKLLPRPTKLSRGHHAAMPYQDVPDFVARLRAAPTVSNRALEFAILTAARSGEVLGATWDEFDLDAKLWRVPAQRMKGGREHLVPLSARALQVLGNHGSGHVFPGAKAERPLSVMALAMAMRRLGAGAYTPHGFRSAFRDWTGDETTYPREIVESALAHAVRDRTEAAYRRSTAFEKRRELMSAWSAHLTEGGGVVIPFRSARSRGA